MNIARRGFITESPVLFVNVKAGLNGPSFMARSLLHFYKIFKWEYAYKEI